MPDRLETAGLAGLLATLGGIWRWLASRRNREADLDTSQANALKASWDAQIVALKALEARLAQAEADCRDLRGSVRELQVKNADLEAKNADLERRLQECERRWAARERRRSVREEAA